MTRAERKTRIHIVVSVTGCDYETALDYLKAEEWSVADAILSLTADTSSN